jgi:hypothetical protein
MMLKPGGGSIFRDELGSEPEGWPGGIQDIGGARAPVEHWDLKSLSFCSGPLVVRVLAAPSCFAERRPQCPSHRLRGRAGRRPHQYENFKAAAAALIDAHTVKFYNRVTRHEAEPASSRTP